MAGALLVHGCDVSGWPYVGLPPELSGAVTLADRVRTILTIENLESFNHPVRTSHEPGDIVVYIGGFPSLAVSAVLRRLAAAFDVVHHWGDVDPGGLRIGRHLESTLGVEVRPHLMDMEMARRLGTIPAKVQAAPHVPEGSAFLELAAYLRTPDAAWLEREVVDPAMVPLDH